jgi:polysaccharide export outer membrane protein
VEIRISTIPAALSAAILLALWAGSCPGPEPREANSRSGVRSDVPRAETPPRHLAPSAEEKISPEVLAEFASLAKPQDMDAWARLKSGDRIRISVYNHPDLTLTVRIPHGGVCNIHLLGPLTLGGKSPKEVETLLKEKLEEKFLTYAHVCVSIQEYASRKAFILGSVVQPGAYDVDPTEGLTLLQLVAMARGFRPDADKEHVKIIRTRGETRRSYTIPILSMMKRRLGALDVPLQPGDRVVVGSLRKIYVLGAVRSPKGIQTLAEEPVHLSRAVSMAGGFAVDADRSSILLLRHTQGGDCVLTVNYGRVEDGQDPSQDVVLRPGDTLIVRQREKVFVLGSVNRSGGFLVPSEGFTATKAISLAGGFSKRADRNGTIVIRFQAGKKTVIPVDVTDVVSGEEAMGVSLRPGDIVYVPERFF